jgi:uncharacterized protein involved in exopolysaccharide biosynthesis
VTALSNEPTQPQAPAHTGDYADLNTLDLLATLAERWKLLIAAPLVLGAAALGICALLPPGFTAKTVFLPPQQQQSSAASALASLGALAGLVGGGGSMKTPGDQYIALMQSTTVEDRMVDRFDLVTVYKREKRFAAREELERNTRIALGKKDGLITVEVDAADPKLAADMANQYVVELGRLTSELALTEAQQRRAFFESELKLTRDRLSTAQKALQAGGFNASAMKAEPKTAAENYARVKAELTSAEVRLQTIRRSMADTSPDVQQQLTMVAALRGQLNQLEAATERSSDADYLGRYREFKYQESLFELFAKQYEMARLDESKEGSSAIQVVDPAKPPEHKSRPRRAVISVGTVAISFLLIAAWLIARELWRHAKGDPRNAAKFRRLDRAWGGRTS